jgi:hypothetical protein
MNRWSLILSVAAICTLASSQAQASYQILRWTSGFCQIWNHAIPGKPLTNDFKASRPFNTFEEALAVKLKLVAASQCW